jgi:DNA-binding transcriptional LysR family regulator
MPAMSRAQLSGVEVRHLQALEGVVEEGSFRGAAERLGYTQGSVSAQIGALEQMIGTSLLDRAPGRPVRLTPAGEAFYQHALDALARLRTAAEDAATAGTSATAARVRLGTYPSVAARVLPPLLNRLAAACPGADVVLTESTSPEALERLVETGRLDLSFAVQPFARPAVDGVALFEDRFCLLVPREHALADRGFPVGLDELGSWPLVLSGTCAHLRHLEAWMRLRGHEPHVALHTDDDGLAHGLVARGVGVAVLTRLQVDRHRDDLVAVELADVVPPRIVALAWARGRPLTPLAASLPDWTMQGTWCREAYA